MAPQLTEKAIILVDPYETRLRKKLQPEVVVTIEPPKFRRRLCVEVFASALRDPLIEPQQRPLFDALVQARYDAPKNSPTDLDSVLAPVRNFIRSSWQRHVWGFDADVVDILHESQRLQEDFKKSRVQGTQIIQDYQSLFNCRQRILETRRRLKRVMYAFGCEDLKLLPIEGPSRQEMKEWTYLCEKLDEVETTIGEYMNMYSQRASMLSARDANVQADAANRQARSASQLTKFATVVVPCTFIASVFSMNGPFAAGERLFFIYWAVSIPVSVLLLLWVVYGNDMQKRWESYRERRKNIKEKGKDEEQATGKFRRLCCQ